MVSKPGITPVMACGMGQSMFWNPFGPKGIFIGIAGFAAGVTLALIFGFSKGSP